MILPLEGELEGVILPLEGELEGVILQYGENVLRSSKSYKEKYYHKFIKHMKKIYMTMAMMAMMSVPTVALAQEEGDDDWGDEPVFSSIENGYFRVINNGYGDVLNLSGLHLIKADQTENEARTMPGTIFYYDTDGIYSFADDMAQFGDNISVADLMQLMATSSWKSGSYSTYDMTSQGVSLGVYLQNLGKYAKAALANFAESEEVRDFYENGPAWYLGVAMFGVFYPADMETLDTFKAAVNRFMARWGLFFDGNIYLKPAQDMENGFLFHFHSPLDIAKMQDTQEQINNMMDEDSGQNLGYNYDFFGTFKKKIVEEAAKELDAEGVAFLQHILDQIDMNKEYYIGENEQGELYVTGFTQEAMFGENGELANINQDELLWIMQPVDKENPLMVEMNKTLLDVDGNYYTTMFTEFPYELKEGVEAYYIDAVNEGVAHLTQIEAKVPANTGVILRSKNAAAVSNTVVPVDEEVAAIEGNLLKGACLPMKAENISVMRLLADGTTGNIVMGKANAVGANQCYIDTPEDGSNVVIAASQNVDPTAVQSVSVTAQQATVVYDLQGRRVINPTKGLYIKNGSKAVVK